jgi:cytochrome P450/pimeloyl-ACP methyl ester carboxylesterase
MSYSDRVTAQSTDLAAPDAVGIVPFVLETGSGPVAAVRAEPGADSDTGVPVVLCAGVVGSKEDFAHLLPAVAKAGYRAYAYDYLGHYGHQDGDAAADHTIARHAADLLAVLAAIGGPAHVVGHSFGGFVVRAAALANPALFRSVTLIGSGPNMDGDRHRTMLRRFDTTLATHGCAVMWPVVRRLIPDSDVTRREFWQARLDRMRLPFLHGALRSLSAETDRSAELRASRLPLLILHGYRDKRLWSAAELAGYAKRAGGDLEVVADASHSPNLEQPAATASALLRFWTEADHRAAVRICIDLVRARAVADPYPSYRRIRQTAPVLTVELPGRTAAVVLTRYADCNRLLSGPGFHSAGEAPERLAPRWRDDRLIRCLYQSFGFREGPEHAAMRAAVAHRLAARRCDSLRADAERIADHLLDGLAERLAGGATVNLVDCLAVPYAALMTGILLGIPDDEALRLGRAARDASAAFEPFMTPRQRIRMAESGDAVIEMLSRLAGDTDDGGLLSMVRAQRPDGDEAYLGDLALLFGATFDSPASLVGLGAKLLLEHPSQARMVRVDPSIVDHCVEEILRYDPPVQVAVRVATEPTRFGHTDVAPGTPLLGMVAAANRDPAYVTDPDRFLVTRRPTRPSLAFGLGRRYCPGAAAGRMQAQVLFPRLLRRFPGLGIAGQPTYRSPGTMLRGLEDLPVALTP